MTAREKRRGLTRQPSKMMQVRLALYPHRRYLRWLRHIARWQMRAPLPFTLKWRFARWVSLLTSGPNELVIWRMPQSQLCLALDLTEATQADLYYRGLPQPQLLDLIKQHLSLTGLFVDVGANVGQEAVWAADLYRRRGMAKGPVIFAFEPNPLIYQRLQHNVSLNSLDSLISINAFAVADADGEATFFLAPSDNGSNSSLMPNRFFGGETITVPVVTLDNFFAKQDAAIRIAMIKVDIEGAELLALRGATQIIARDRPILILEACPEFMSNFGYNYSDLYSFLRSHGYSVYVIRRKGLLADTTGRLPDDEPYYNLICLPNSQ